MVEGKVIYDCFMFFNEVELLELRLKTLYKHVDYFVLVEIGKTHTGKDKPYHYEEFSSLFEKYSDKIIYVKHPGFINDDAWFNENAHRNLISFVLKDINDEDYVMISDIDEIPNPDAVIREINSGKEIFSLMQQLFCFYVNCTSTQEWIGTVVAKKKLITSPQDMRNNRHSYEFIRDGGWHYSSMGGKERIRTKFESFAETQLNTTSLMSDENLDICLETGKDLTDREDKWAQKYFIPLEDITHTELLEWYPNYPNFIKL
jgi:beta-1,4-mannosyl-glycoprotein beta-1,4-N-acetylglucosaminyltransferase